MTRLGTIISALSELRFQEIGSLIEEEGKFVVKESLSPALVWHQRDSLGEDVNLGPFKHDADFFESLISAFLLHVKELPIEQHVLFAPIPERQEYDDYLKHRAAVGRWNDFVTVDSKIDGSKNRLDYFILGHFLKNMLPLLCNASSMDACVSGNNFPLCHPDLSTSNIFVDNDFNITCIINWASSSTVPVSMLLATPSFPHPRNEAEMTMHPIFRSNLLHHLSGERKASIDNKFWNLTRRVWLFTRLVLLDGLQDYRYFKELYSLAYESEDINIPKMFSEMKCENEFVALAKSLAADDRPADEIRMEEREYFRCDNVGKEAVARKLTVMAGLSKNFVADKKLWKWLDDALV